MSRLPEQPNQRWKNLESRRRLALDNSNTLLVGLLHLVKDELVLGIKVCPHRIFGHIELQENPKPCLTPGHR